MNDDCLAVKVNVELEGYDETLHKITVLYDKLKEAKSLADDIASQMAELELQI